MTVLSTVNKMAPQAMNGVTTVFSFTFRSLVDFPDGIKAVISDTTGTNPDVDLIYNDGGSDGYTVSVDADGIGGSITVNDSRSADWEITIYREYEITQESNYADYNSFPAETVENGYDKRAMVEQQINETVGRSVTLPITVTGVSTELPAPVADYIIGWNGTADALINYDPAIIGAASAAAAAASAAAAATSEANAAASAAAAAASVVAAAAEVVLCQAEVVNCQTEVANAALEVTYAAEWANKAYGSLISAAAGGDLVDDYSALSHAVSSDHWATYPEDSLIPVLDGGDGATDYSALHWAAKALASAAALNLPTPLTGHALEGIRVNAGQTGYEFTVLGSGTLVDDFTIKNPGGIIELNPDLMTAIVQNRMAILALGDTTSGDYTDGVSDTYTDQAGIDLGASSGQVFEGGSYRTPAPIPADVDKLIMNFNAIEGTHEAVDSVDRHVATFAGSSSPMIIPRHYKWGNSSFYRDAQTSSGYLNFGDDAAWAFGTGIVCVDYWVKDIGFYLFGEMFQKETGSLNKEITAFINDDGSIRFGTYDSNGGGIDVDAVSPPGNITDSDWHHVMMLRDGTDLSIYLDGYQVAYGTGAAQNITSTGSLIINGHNSNRFLGYMDEFRIVTATDPFSASPIALPYSWYTMGDDAASTVVTDYGSGANNGASVGGNTDIFHAAGKINHAFSLNGSTRAFDIDAVASGINADTSGMVMFWFNRSSATEGIVFSVGNSAADSRANVGITSAGTAFYWLQTQVGSLGNYNQFSYTSGFTVGVWYHMALYSDGVDRVKAYVNGEQAVESTGPGANGRWMAYSTGLNVGNVGCQTRYNGNARGNFFDAVIEDLRYYSNTVPTQAQVQSVIDGANEGFYALGEEITVPTGAHTPDGNTVLLIHFTDGNLDDSSATGAIQLSSSGAKSFPGYGNGIFYLNGTADYWTIPDSADWDIVGSAIDNWTIGFWVQHGDHVGQEIYITQYQDGSNYWTFQHQDGQGIQFDVAIGGVLNPRILSGGEITDHNWHYITLCKVANEYGTYKDGAQVGYAIDSSTGTFSGALTIGQQNSVSFLEGAMSDIFVHNENYFSAAPNAGDTDTITVPSAQLTPTADTKLYLTGDPYGISPRYQSPVFTGSEVRENHQKWGRGALALVAASSQYLTIPDSVDWDIVGSLADSYTIDLWIKHNTLPASATQYYVAQWEDGTNQWRLFTGTTQFGFICVGDGKTGLPSITPGVTITDYDWHHLSVCKVAGDWGMYLDGVQIGYDTQTETDTFSAQLHIGHNAGVSPSYFDGYLDDLNINHANLFSAAPVVGLTDTITVPTAAHSVDGNSKLLCHFDPGTFASFVPQDLADASGTHTLTSVNDAHVTGPFSGSPAGRVFFNGTTDTIMLPRSADWDLFARIDDSWTLDFWFNSDQWSTTHYFITQYEDANNRWLLNRNAGIGVTFTLVVDGVTAISFNQGSDPAINNWHHVALVKLPQATNAAIQCYVNGDQIGYGVQSRSAIDRFLADIYIGSSSLSSAWFFGEMAAFRLIQTNYFGASLSPAVTDTIILDSTEPELTAPSAGTMLLQSIATTALAQPDDIKIYFDLEDIDPTILLNTDIVVSVSRDGGTTFTTATMALAAGVSPRRIIEDTVDVTGQPAGTDIKYKVQTANDVQMRLHAVSMLWD